MPAGGFTEVVHASSYDHISPLNLDLSGRHVLITGAAYNYGVGYAIATALARGGASGIALVDVLGIDDSLIASLELAALEAGRSKPIVVGYTADITDRDTIVDVILPRLLEKFDHRLDCLINNAAHQEPSGTILEIDPDVYWKTWQVNIGGLFNMTRAFLPVLLDQPENALRTVINVASSGGLAPRAGGASYRTSKTAIMRWTENLQLDHVGQGLLTYCVNPGAIKTEITKGVLADAVRDRLPHKADVAGDTITWLLSERREWLAGRYVSCPWDMRALAVARDDIVKGDKLKLRLLE